MLGAKFVLYRRSVLLIRSSSHSSQRRTPTASALSFPALKRLSQKVQIETIQLYKCLNCQGEKSRRVRLCTLLRQPLKDGACRAFWSTEFFNCFRIQRTALTAMKSHRVALAPLQNVDGYDCVRDVLIRLVHGVCA